MSPSDFTVVPYNERHGGYIVRHASGRKWLVWLGDEPSRTRISSMKQNRKDILVDGQLGKQILAAMSRAGVPMRVKRPVVTERPF
jgi:hypothetical protein